MTTGRCQGLLHLPAKRLARCGGHLLPLVALLGVMALALPAATPTAAAPASGTVTPARPLPPRAPGLGLEPQPCKVLVYGDTSCVLQSGVGTFSLSPHVVHAGERITGTLAPHCNKSCLGGWDWRGTLIPGIPVAGCRNSIDTSCTWKIPKSSPSKPWTVAILNYGTWAGHAESRDFYAIIGKDRPFLEGFVRDDSGNPISNTVILIEGASSWSAVTSLNGYYNAFLPAGTYTVTPLVDPKLMNPGAQVKPVASADCTPRRSSCLVHLDYGRTTTASFVVPGCKIEPKEILGWKIDGDCPAHAQDGASGVKITPPASLDGLKALLDTAGYMSGLVTANNDGTYTLNYNLPMKDRSHLALPVLLPDVSISIGSLGLSAYGLSVDEQSLGIDSAAFNLGSNAQAIVYDLRAASGSVTAGSLELDIYGATVDAQDVTISSGGISAASATIGLPQALGGSSATLSGFSVGADGSVHGALSGFTLRLGDLYGEVNGMTFTPTGLSLTGATLHLPIPGTKSGCTFSIGGLTYDGNTITLQNASAQVHAALAMGRISIDGNGQFTLQSSAAGTTYGFQGDVQVTIPGVFAHPAHVMLQIGPLDSGHSSHLYQVHFEAQFNTGIPIDGTGLELTGLSGDIDTTHAAYTFGLGGTVASDDGGHLFSGALEGVLATDGNIGIGVKNGTILSVIQVSAGLCLRLIDEADTVCQQVMPGHPESGLGQGIFLTADGGLNATLFGYGAQLTLGAYGKVQRMGGQVYIEASARGMATLSAPGLRATGEAVGQFGRFLGPAGPVVGLKAAVSGTLVSTHPVSITRSLFVDDAGNITTSSGTLPYTLTEPGTVPHVRSGAALPYAPVAAAPSATPIPAPSATPTPPPVSGSFHIARGETDALFSLTWQSGAPALTLVAPNGRLITPQQPGAGVYPVTTTVGNSVTLFLPRPQAGRWQARIGNLHGGEGFRFTVEGNAPQPALTVSVPRRGQTLLARPARPRVTIAGRLNGGASNATLSLFYTTAPTVLLTGKRTSNFAGTLLAARVPVRHGAWRYVWDTSAVPPGRYYVYATLDNGAGPLVSGYGSGSVVVKQPARPAVPRGVRGAQHGDTLALRWRPPAQAGPVVGYVVRYRPRGLSDEPWLSEDVGNVQSVVISGTRTDVSYDAAVAAYDVAGHQSSWVAGRISGGPSMGRRPTRSHGPGSHGKRPHIIVSGETHSVVVTRSGRGVTGSAGVVLAPELSAGSRLWSVHGAVVVTDGPHPHAQVQLPADLPIFGVYYGRTPQIAYNDAGAMSGWDYSTSPPTRAVTWGLNPSTGKKEWLPYLPIANPSELSYDLYVKPVPTDEQHEVGTDRRRRAAGCIPTPFGTWTPNSANNQLKHVPTGWLSTWTSCDEYPFASTTQGGRGSIIRGVPVAENNIQGGQFSAFLRQNAVVLSNDGGWFKVCVIGIPGHSLIGSCK